MATARSSHSRWRPCVPDLLVLTTASAHMPASFMGEPSPAFDAGLKALLDHLREQSYEFQTVTPLSHARVLVNRRGNRATSPRDVFGWSLAFAAPLALSLVLGWPKLVSLCLLGFLSLFFGMRFMKSKKLMPAGLMAILSVLTLVLHSSLS